MRNRKRFQAVCAGVLVAGLAVAWARQSPVRRITETEATSGCIGDPRTPMCAVKTFVACFARRDISLCRKVGVGTVSLGSEMVLSEYVLVSRELIRAEAILDRLRDSYWYRPGYVDITLARRDHYAGGKARPWDGWRNYGYSVKPVDGAWHVASWAA